ncbi:MAG: DUF4381 family protein [Rikenellaceae bacterium]
MFKKLFILFALWLMGTSGVSAQLLDTKVGFSLSRDSLMIGDTLTIRLDVDKDVARDISLPGFKDNMMTESIEIIDGPLLDTLSKDERLIRLRINYVITAFDAGNYILDSFPLLIGSGEPFDTLFTVGADSIIFTTYPVDTTKDVVVDIKPILGAPYSWAEFKKDVARYWWVALVAIIVIVLILIGVRFYKRRRREKMEALRALPAHEKAIMQLERIRNKKLYQNEKYKEYFSEITDTLRVYLEDRYGVQAMEMTSAEILRAIKEIDLLPKLQKSMAELFGMADLAKFARGVADADECETAFFDACYFVEQTRQEEIEDDTDDEK